MEQNYNLWVAGGDLRQCCLARLLAEDGQEVHLLALERADPIPGVIMELEAGGVGNADCVILPLPVLGGDGMLQTPLSDRRWPLDVLLGMMNQGQVICGGRVTAEVRDAAAHLGLTVRDYFSREELAVANAVPTAEGAIQIAMEELPITLQEARVLIIGYGRLGKVLVQRFRALGAHVSVAARKCSDLAWVRVCGAEPIAMENLSDRLGNCDLVINTAPACLLGKERLKKLDGDSLIIDLASRPGGVDMNAAAELGVRVIWALSLPGKVAPVTAGRGIRDAVYHILKELGV